MSQDKHELDIEREAKESAKEVKKNQELDFKKEMDALRERQNLERAAEFQRWVDSFMEKHKKYKGTNQETTLWEELLRKADDAANPDRSGYYDFSSTMMQLLAMFSIARDAIEVSLQQTAVGMLNLEGPRAIRERGSDILWWAAGALKERISNAITGGPPLTLPTLMNKVHFKEGTLQVDPLEPKGGTFHQKFDSEKLNNSFKALVDLWLVENGYDKKPNGSYAHETKGLLDEAKFNALKNDDEHGLKKFLDKAGQEEGLTFEENQRPTM